MEIQVTQKHIKEGERQPRDQTIPRGVETRCPIFLALKEHFGGIRAVGHVNNDRFPDVGWRSVGKRTKLRVVAHFCDEDRSFLQFIYGKFTRAGEKMTASDWVSAFDAGAPVTPITIKLGKMAYKCTRGPTAPPITIPIPI